PEILRAYGQVVSGPAAFGEPEAERWVSWLTAHPNAWVIEGEGRLLGAIRLDNVNHDDKRASLAIGLFNIADAGKGTGSEAARAVLRFAFDRLELHRVSVRVLEFNTRAIRLYAKLGFQVEGKERETAFVDGKWCDDLIMGLLEREFLAG